MQIWPGHPYPLGAIYDGTGVHFSLFSEVAERVGLCLFDEAGQETRVDLPEVTSYCWHGYLPQVQPSQRYGFRVHGPWALEEGQRCSPAKLLLDPYAKAIEGQVQWDEAVSRIISATPPRPAMIAIAPHSCPSRWSSTPSPIGGTIDTPVPPGTKP